jgi:hypothetical protein
LFGTRQYWLYKSEIANMPAKKCRRTPTGAEGGFPRRYNLLFGKRKNPAGGPGLVIAAA